MKLQHIILNTGDSSFSTMEGIESEELCLLQGWIEIALDIHDLVILPGTKFEEYPIRLLTSGECLACTVFEVVDGEPAPLIHCGISPGNGDQNKRFWAIATQEPLNEADVSMPKEGPWAVTTSFPRLHSERALMKYISDFLYYLSWAWITKPKKDQVLH